MLGSLTDLQEQSLEQRSANNWWGWRIVTPGHSLASRVTPRCVLSPEVPAGPAPAAHRAYRINGRPCTPCLPFPVSFPHCPTGEFGDHLPYKWPALESLFQGPILGSPTQDRMKGKMKRADWGALGNQERPESLPFFFLIIHHLPE